jgi:hypothetical protein
MTTESDRFPDRAELERRIAAHHRRRVAEPEQGDALCRVAAGSSASEPPSSLFAAFEIRQLPRPPT